MNNIGILSLILFISQSIGSLVLAQELFTKKYIMNAIIIIVIHRKNVMMTNNNVLLLYYHNVGTV